MSMRSKNSPRRVYVRSGSLVICLAGCYFGPKHGVKTFIDASKEVTTEVLKPAGGRKCIQIEQIAAGGASIVEVWSQKLLSFKKRGPKADADAIGSMLPEPPAS